MAGLAQRLRDAAAGQDWAALAEADRDLARFLAIAAAQGLPAPAERTALQALRLAHGQARTLCAEAGEQLARRMADMQTSKDGWLAYALHSDPNESPNGPTT
jgi:hypothetical protein